MTFVVSYALRDQPNQSTTDFMPKTKTFLQLQREIAALQKEADQARQREVADVISRIKDAISTYQLTASDLGFGAHVSSRAMSPSGARGPRKAAVQAKKSKSSRPVKYRDDSGNIWVGRGPRPAWLSAAIKSGKKLEDFAV
jgi:DNA-binding protein H-NS